VPIVWWSDERTTDEGWGAEPPAHLLELQGGVVIVRRPSIPLRQRFRAFSTGPVVDTTDWRNEVAKRKRKEVEQPVNGDAKVSNYTSRLFDDGRKLHDLRLACGHLKRVAQPGPVHLQKFIDRVFTIAGVGESESKPAEEAHTD
jgi:hypothetical protein